MDTQSLPVSIPDVIRASAQKYPEQEAIVDGTRSVSYAEFDDLVDRVACGLVTRGVAPGDVVAVSLANGADVLVAVAAIMRAGAVFVGVHPGLAPPEKIALLQSAGTVALICSPAVARQLDEPEDSTGMVVLTIDPERDGIGALAGSAVALPQIDASEPAAIAFTSGTTGRPKGVIHDHAHCVLPAAVILFDRMQGRSERVGVQLPLTTLNVVLIGPVLAWLGGGSCICLRTHEPAQLAAEISNHRIEHLSCSPATVHDLVESADVRADQLANVRLGVGGAACPERLRSAYAVKFGSSFTTGYGLSEAPASVVQESDEVPHRVGASGKAMGHVDAVILDERGDVVPPGELGQIAVEPARTGNWANAWQGMIGYHNDSEATRSVKVAGRILTGDRGRLDDDGYLYVEDRRSDLISRGGATVSPLEVERVLREHRLVADCIVVGIEDDRLGETVAAMVELREPLADAESVLRSHCRSSLAGFKVPEHILVDRALPRNPMGKVVRASVRSIFRSVTKYD